MISVNFTGNGFIDFLDSKILLLCGNYFYTGTLRHVSKECLLLEDAYIVYETGPLDASWYKDAQKLGTSIYVRVSTVESFMPGKVNS